MSGQIGGENGHRPQQAPNQIVHMRENSDSALNELFEVLKTNNKQPGSSYKNKNLPQSFFNPPDPNRHSRENSQDSTFVPNHHPGLIPNHGRSRSSPAQLPNTLSIANPTPTPNHRPQHSVDIIEDIQMPAGWDRRYNFNSPNSQTPQWANQQTSPVQQPQHTQKSQSIGNLVESLSPASSHGPSPAVSQQNVSLDLRLPPGWDISVTQDMEVYFINHMNKTTSWYHPAIPKHQQGPGPIKLAQLPPAQQQQILQQSQAHQAQQNAAGQPVPQSSPIQSPPQQQPQQQLSPNVAPPPRRSPSTGASATQVPQAPPIVSVNGGGNEHNIFMELQRLQKEKERLQREQEEISRKERLLQRNFGNNSPNQSQGGSLGIIEESPAANTVTRPFQELILKDLMSPSTSQAGDAALQQQQAAVLQSSSGVDPFLGSESHARQNSADSGLGGMGTNSYSLPRTPEDFLSNVDEMDSSDGGQKLLKHGLSSDFNMNDMQGPTSMDIGTLDGDNSTAMGGDDLVPSLQEDMLNSDLLNDMDIINQADIPTWL